MAPQHSSLSIASRVGTSSQEPGRASTALGRTALAGISTLALALAVLPLLLPRASFVAAGAPDGSLLLLGIGFVSVGALLRSRPRDPRHA